MMLGHLSHFSRPINPRLPAFLIWLGLVGAFGLGGPTLCRADGPPISFSLSLAVGRSPTALVVTDLNRDGRPDLAVANSDSDSVSLLFGSAPANFLPAVGIPVVGGPTAIASADLNRDLRPDLLVSGGIDDVVMTLLSAPHNRAEIGIEFATGTGPSGLAMPDLDRDGQQDLVVTNGFDGTISVFRGKPDGSFLALGDLETGEGFDSGPLGLAAGDFTGDGLVDLVVANQMEDSVTVFSGDGQGGFSSSRTFEADALPTAARIADVSGDQIPDIVTVNEGSDTVVILVGDGQGDVRSRISLDTGGFPESVAVQDLNGDGLAEIVTADSFSDVVSIFAASEGGIFDDRIVFPVGRSPFDVVVGDFNADGRPDLATANLDDDTVSILLNTTPYSVRHGDVNGDRAVDSNDASAWLAEMFDGDGDLIVQVEGGKVRSAPTADANLDGFVSVADFVALQREIARRRSERLPQS